MKKVIFFILGIIFELFVLIIIASEFTERLGANFVILGHELYPFVFLVTMVLGTYGTVYFNKKLCNPFFSGMIVGFFLYMIFIVLILEPVRF